MGNCPHNHQRLASGSAPHCYAAAHTACALIHLLPRTGGMVTTRGSTPQQHQPAPRTHMHESLARSRWHGHKPSTAAHQNAAAAHATHAPTSLLASSGWHSSRSSSSLVAAKRGLPAATSLSTCSPSCSCALTVRTCSRTCGQSGQLCSSNCTQAMRKVMQPFLLQGPWLLGPKPPVTPTLCA